MNDGEDKTSGPGHRTDSEVLKSPTLFDCGAFINLSTEIDRLQSRCFIQRRSRPQDEAAAQISGVPDRADFHEGLEPVG